MPPEDRDFAYLWDMLDAARAAVEIAANISLEALAADRMRMLALERVLEIIGEAARRVSESYRDAHPTIPWRAIIGQRNIIAHEYGSIDHPRLIETVKRDLPALIATIEALLPASGERAGGA